jgi:hypothetical protein
MFQRFLGMLKRFLRMGIVASFYGFFQMRDGFFLVRDALLGMLDDFLDMPIIACEYGANHASCDKTADSDCHNDGFNPAPNSSCVMVTS